MTNDITNVNLENAIPCFALSKHGSYVMSTYGGKVSLFNMMTFNLKFHPCTSGILKILNDPNRIFIHLVIRKEFLHK
ncbi:hypothetical protein ACJIZ3_000326 [Penstemon smallii]|uniref:Uncharacterized protein n=1 Tax=Penstemon smallii TaxID=265156 RepID=A0ABD3R529_9LAMI